MYFEEFPKVKLFDTTLHRNLVQNEQTTEYVCWHKGTSILQAVVAVCKLSLEAVAPVD